MKQIFSFIISQLKYFFLNPFWKSWVILGIIFLGLVLNIIIWYLFKSFYHNIVSLTPVVYSSAVLLLNLFLANIIYRKRDMAAYLFLSATILVQIFILFYLKIAYLAGAF